MLPHGDTHVLATEVGMRKSPEMSMYRRPDAACLPSTISVGTENGEPAHFVCGFLGCDSRPYNPLLTALPRVIRVSDPASGALGAYFRAALAESKGRMGGECMLGRISELMFVDVVRRYLETLPPDRNSWLGGLRDPYVGRALTALHDNPARDWTLEALAQEAALSRSAFAERFAQFVGHPPMQYLTNWRMQLATNYLRSGTESVAAVANRVGLRFRGRVQPRIQEGRGHAAQRMARATRSRGLTPGGSGKPFSKTKHSVRTTEHAVFR